MKFIKDFKNFTTDDFAGSVMLNHEGEMDYTDVDFTEQLSGGCIPEEGDLISVGDNSGKVIDVQFNYSEENETLGKLESISVAVEIPVD